MRALTVRQPWAEYLVNGLKLVEVRSRPTTHRGRLAIHSAKTFDDIDPIDGELDLPRGVIVGTVELYDCIPLTEGLFEAAMFEGDPADLWAWRVRDPQRVEPVEWRGQLSLWNIPDELIEAVG